jgi:hypothetical protein
MKARQMNQGNEYGCTRKAGELRKAMNDRLSIMQSMCAEREDVECAHDRLVEQDRDAIDRKRRAAKEQSMRVSWNQGNEYGCTRKAGELRETRDKQ